MTTANLTYAVLTVAWAILLAADQASNRALNRKPWNAGTLLLMAAFTYWAIRAVTA